MADMGRLVRQLRQEHPDIFDEVELDCEEENEEICAHLEQARGDAADTVRLLTTIALQAHEIPESSEDEDVPFVVPAVWPLMIHLWPESSFSFAYPSAGLNETFGEPPPAHIGDVEKEVSRKPAYTHRKVRLYFFMMVVQGIRKETTFHVFRARYTLRVDFVLQCLTDVDLSILAKNAYREMWGDGAEDLLPVDGGHILKGLECKIPEFPKNRGRATAAEMLALSIEDRLWFRYEGFAPAAKMFRKKIPALEYARATGLAAFSWDINDTNGKMYLVCSYYDVTNLRYTPEATHRIVRDIRRNAMGLWREQGGYRCLNEFVMLERETKPFVDMEYPLEGNEHLFDEESIERITRLVIALMAETLGKIIAPRTSEFPGSDFVVLDSTRPTKVSRHIIYDGPWFFRGTEDACRFSRLMEVHVGLGVLAKEPTSLELMIRDKRATKQSICGVQQLARCCTLAPIPDSPVEKYRAAVDWGVYSNKDKTLRMCGCAKRACPDYLMCLVSDGSENAYRTLDQMSTKYNGELDLSDSVSSSNPDDQASFFGSLIQFVPRRLAAVSENCLHVSEDMMQRIVADWKRPYAEKCQDDPHLLLAMKNHAKVLARGRGAKRAREALFADFGNFGDENKRRRNKRFRSAPIKPEKKRHVVDWSIDQVDEWKRDFGGNYDDVKVTVCTFCDDHGQTHVDSIRVYPNKLNHCPIRKGHFGVGEHSAPGKTGMIVTAGGEYKFMCQSSGCKNAMSAKLFAPNRPLFGSTLLDVV